MKKNTNLVIGVVAVGLVGLYLYNKNKQTPASTTPQATAGFANATGRLTGLTSPSRLSPKQECLQQPYHSWQEVSYPHPSGVGRMYIYECVDNSVGK